MYDFRDFSLVFKEEKRLDNCTTGTRDIELSTVGKRVERAFQQCQARRQTLAWCRKFNEKTDENRALLGEVKPCFRAEKNVCTNQHPMVLDTEVLSTKEEQYLLAFW